MELTAEQLDTLRHMLGINDPSLAAPVPTRNYYAAEPGDANLAALAQLGAVERYSTAQYWWYRCTEAGMAAAIASHKAIQYPKKRRVYFAYLRVADINPDLTFREFLTDDRYREYRQNA